MRVFFIFFRSNNFLPETQQASIQICMDIFTGVTLLFLYINNNKCWEEHNFLPGTPTGLDSKRSDLSIFYNTNTNKCQRERKFLPGASTGLNRYNKIYKKQSLKNVMV